MREGGREGMLQEERALCLEDGGMLMCLNVGGEEGPPLMD